MLGNGWGASLQRSPPETPGEGWAALPKGCKSNAPSSGSLGTRLFSFSKQKAGDDICVRSPGSTQLPGHGSQSGWAGGS